MNTLDHAFLRRQLVRLSRSRFFSISVGIHVLLLVILSGIVLQRPPDAEKSPFVSDFVPPPREPASPPPRPQPQNPTPLAPTAPNSAEVTRLSPPTIPAITTKGANPASFMIPSFRPASPEGATMAPPPTSSPGGAGRMLPDGLTPEDLRRIGEFADWAVPDPGQPPGALNKRRFKFTAYLAKYAGGDWDSTVELREGKIVKGSFPNLLHVMRTWSADRIDASAEPAPLDLASDEIMTVRPPFILFTGRRDFVLTDAEVANLRRYILSGGAIWGDSSLPGRRSRFDIAFRREMRRVLSDVNKGWEVLPASHPLFTRNYFPEVKSPPPGVNFYQEPVYVMKFGGEIAVLYTANDYGDMLQTGLREDGSINLDRDEKNRYVATNWQLHAHRDIYFRGIDRYSVNASYRFGINVVVHLLVRWENALRNVPRL